jgi:biopolymer transport protein ExbD
MAEVIEHHDDGGRIRASRRSTRIDMTPLVDLAFLLLTFFILTTVFTDDRVLVLTMPGKPEESNPAPPISARNVLNLVLAKDNSIYWWIGLDPPVGTTNFSKDGVRHLLLEQRRVNPHIMVLIKPRSDAKYRSVVDILDEMNITGIDRYAIVDFTGDDERILSHEYQRANATGSEED